MDFFAHQDAARGRSRWLVVLFLLAVAAIVAAIYLVAAGLLHGVDAEEPLWDPALLLGVALGTGLVVSGGSLYKTAMLSRGGGEGVAALLGGRPVDPQTRDAAERRLLNVVEEMALAAGAAVPTVYVLPNETAINAFAAGHRPDTAVIGITRGALERLDRDELQGVVAHELSHVLNGDMRLNLRLMGLLHGILVVSLIGYWLLRAGGGGMRSSGKEKGGAAGLALFGLAVYVIGWIGVFFGDLIKSAVSRQREYLADAAAVQFTRNPGGLAGALKKIAAAGGARLQAKNAAQASHLFFGNALGEKRLAWRSTHPPLADRIRRLDPGWDGSMPAPAEPAGPVTTASDRDTIDREAARAAAASLAGGAEGGPTPVRATPQPAPTPAEVATSVGRPDPVRLGTAAAVLAALPPGLRERAHEPMAARAVALALLCDRQPAVRARQLAHVAAAGDAALAAELATVLPLVTALPDAARLPVVDLALPALRRLSSAQYQAFRSLVDDLARADERLSLFEYTLHRVLLRHLDAAFAPRPAPRVAQRHLGGLGEPVTALLSTLAWVGGDGDAATAAFAAGVRALGGHSPRGLALLSREECTFRRLDDALARLATVAPGSLRAAVTACAATVAHDGVVTGPEAELLRAVCDALGCPVPPLAVAA